MWLLFGTFSVFCVTLIYTKYYFIKLPVCHRYFTCGLWILLKSRCMPKYSSPKKKWKILSLHYNSFIYNIEYSGSVVYDFIIELYPMIDVDISHTGLIFYTKTLLLIKLQINYTMNIAYMSKTIIDNHPLQRKHWFINIINIPMYTTYDKGTCELYVIKRQTTNIAPLFDRSFQRDLKNQCPLLNWCGTFKMVLGRLQRLNFLPLH